MKRAKTNGQSAHVRSKATRMRERERRCDELYWEHGRTAPEIADLLIEEHQFEPDASPSASRKWAAERIAKIRGDADPTSVLLLQRPAETERYRKQLLRALRDLLSVVEDDSLVARERLTPKGDVKTVMVPKWTPADKVRAMKEYRETARKLALVNAVNVEGEVDATDQPSAGDEGLPPTVERAGSFNFNFSGKSVEALIGDRTGRGGTVN